MKKQAVGNLGAEELARVSRYMKTRSETRAEADVLFGNTAKKMRAEDRKKLEKLFVQAPAAVTMAPNLQKEAGDMPHFTEQDRPAKVKEIYRALKRDNPNMPAEVKARIASRKGKKSPESRKPPETGGPAYKAPLHFEHKGGKYKASSEQTSMTPNIDAFLEKLSEASLTEAQRRYPELMKVAYANATTKTPSLKKRSPTDITGPGPVKSDLSGGSA